MPQESAAERALLGRAKDRCPPTPRPPRCQRQQGFQAEIKISLGFWKIIEKSQIFSAYLYLGYPGNVISVPPCLTYRIVFLTARDLSPQEHGVPPPHGGLDHARALVSPHVTGFSCTFLRTEMSCAPPMVDKDVAKFRYVPLPCCAG